MACLIDRKRETSKEFRYEFTVDGVSTHGLAREGEAVPLPPAPSELPGAPCYCGLEGCIETWLSGPGLARDYREATGIARQSPAIVGAAAAGDAAAEAALQRSEDPEAIVLGGGVSNLERLYASVPRLWQRYVFSDTVRTRLLPPMHGDSSGVRGAAWLGRRRALAAPT